MTYSCVIDGYGVTIMALDWPDHVIVARSLYELLQRLENDHDISKATIRHEASR
jgi:hypothetical protein